MLNFRASDDYRPLFYVGKVPVYVTTLLVGIYSACMILFSLISGFGGTTFLRHLPLVSSELLNGAIWQPMTYLFVQPPSLWFVFQMLFFYRFGRDVESFLGRAAFLRLYIGLAATIPVLVVLYGFIQPVAFPSGDSGTSLLHFAVFLAFALIFPSIEVIWVIQARWLAAALFGLYTLILFSAQDWIGLGLLWPLAFATYILCCSAGVTDRFGVYDFLCRLMPAKAPQKKPVSRSARTRRSAEVSANSPADLNQNHEADLHSMIDPLLDKIAAKGISSLTPKERAVLEKARHQLLEAENQSRR